MRIPPLIHEGQSFKLIEGPSGGIFLHIGGSLRNDVSFRFFKLYFDELILFSDWRSDFVEERFSTNVPKLKVNSSAKEHNLLAQKSNKHQIERREGSRVVHVKRNDLLCLFVHHLNGITLNFRPWNVISFREFFESQGFRFVVERKLQYFAFCLGLAEKVDFVKLAEG